MTCTKCRSTETRSYGKHRNGLRRFRCLKCGKTFTEPHTRPLGPMQIEFERAVLPLEILLEGGSIRTAERITGVPRNTIMSLLLVAGANAEKLLGRAIRNVPVTDVQCDEIWGFVFKKQGSKRGDEERFAYIGDAWTFVAIERYTKLVLAFELGKRTVTSAMRFTEKLATATDPNQRFQLTTDGLNAYPYAIGNLLMDRVDYAQLIKIYAQETPESIRRYSPPRLAETSATPIYGDPDEKKICTSHVERQNLTMRMCMRRLTRLTNGFSKKWENLKAALALHFAYYNFCRRHRTLKTTPAVAAGLTDRPWTLRELLLEAAA
ncbi:MAG: IS1 family transposase [Terriglobia bacterium]|nr:MAG: IS1 family transposase [Terriglobia bacterium]